jgi:hypothetical protein
MSMYRFCGVNTEVGDLVLKKFGQRVDLSDDAASEVILGGGCIVPAADFEKISFTEQEISIYADAFSHVEANAAFLAKKKRALLICHEIRTRLQRGEPFKTVPDLPAVPIAPTERTVTNR